MVRVIEFPASLRGNVIIKRHNVRKETNRVSPSIDGLSWIRTAGVREQARNNNNCVHVNKSSCIIS